MANSIALVDDDKNILASVAIALEAEGFQVRTYSDGAEALRGLAAQPADLAILDIKMPRMDGMEVLRRLRQTSPMPVIMLTSKDEEIDEILSFPLPSSSPHSITRPAELDALLDRVRRDGYAVNRGGYREGVGGVAAPVRDYTGRVVASVGLGMPEQRFGADRFEVLRDWTVEAASAISAALGGPAAPVLAAGAPGPG